jgi:lipoprotein-anchoring transpeptidase ErfK/SrfK
VETIGHAVLSGGTRLFNRDIVDLTNRVPVGTHKAVGQG